MTPAKETSLMVTFITVFFGGVISAVVTLVLGQPLQHYFWRRQRYVERQFAMIEELNAIVAAVDTQLVTEPLSREVQQSLYQRMVTLTANIRPLFSPPAVEPCQALRRAIRGLRAVDPNIRAEIRLHIQEVHQDAIRALYQDMGIPPTPPGQWIREHAWQPLRTQVWERPQQYWDTTCWPTLQRWGATSTTRLRQSRERRRRRRSGIHRTIGDV
jgi:hypothetical protein